MKVKLKRARPPKVETPELSDMTTSASVRLAVEVAAAGAHNLLLIGSPGVGHTMLARRLAGLLPRLDVKQALEVARIYSAAGREPMTMPEHPPFRMPHHTVSAAGMFGGGTPVRPGEVSLAHNGVLYLDELPEFSAPVLQGLREVLERGSVTIVRASGVLHLPARFRLLASALPCPCGYLGHPERACIDPPTALDRYKQRLASLSDLFDLRVTMPNTAPDDDVQPHGALLHRPTRHKETPQ